VRAWRDTGPTPHFKPLRFLLIFVGFTVLFFSASGSKLAPYLQPVFPPLAALLGVYAADRASFVRGAALRTALLVSVVALALPIYSAVRNSFVPHLGVLWAGAAMIAVVAAAGVAWRGSPDSATPAWVTAAAGALAWQCFITALGEVPPARSARDLVAAVKPYVHPQTALYSVGQYRETISPYLERTLTVVEFDGELRFGMLAEPGKNQASRADFVARWKASTDAVAFFGPTLWAWYRQQGLPGKVIAADNYTVAVSRS
jgi:4-amino-4-deoxy-L-arabinose transferase-like glycosyltransferase